MLLLSTALAAAGASAAESRLAPVDAGGDVAAAKQESAMAERLRQEEVRLRAERASYPAHFKRAFAWIVTLLALRLLWQASGF